MYNHFTTSEAQRRHNDGLLESRMVVSRDGIHLRYISRRAWPPRGIGKPRPGETGVFEGAFDAAWTNVGVGVTCGSGVWRVRGQPPRLRVCAVSSFGTLLRLW